MTLRIFFLTCLLSTIYLGFLFPINAREISQDTKSIEQEESIVDSDIKPIQNNKKYKIILRYTSKDKAQSKIHIIQNVMKEFEDFDFISSIRTIVITGESLERRGYAGEDIIVIKDNISDQEFRNVFIHEMAHTIDLGFLNTPSENKSPFKDNGKFISHLDKSTSFYGICWKNEEQSKCQRDDFISGYAMTNIFEDFAESFLFYVNYHDTFISMAEKNPLLRAKYQFLHHTIFNKNTFPQNKVFALNTKQPWDMTKL
jgi:hypothetical protein